MPVINNHIKYCLFIFIFLLSLGVVSSSFAFETKPNQRNPFKVSYNEGPISVESGSVYKLLTTIYIPNGYYLYADTVKVTVTDAQGLTLSSLEKPDAELKNDPITGEEVMIYHDMVMLRLPVSIPADFKGAKITGTIEYQGCSTNLCYPLLKTPFEITLASGTNLSDSSQGQTSIDQKKMGFIAHVLALLKDPQALGGEALWFLIIVAFIGGVLTDFTFCVWPMIPVTLAVIGVRKDRTILNNLKAVFVLILGMAVMYSILGVIAVALGKTLGFIFQSRIFLGLLIAMLALMGFSLLGLFDIHLPSSLQTRISHLTATGYKGIFLIGLTMGILAAPCVAPIAGSILLSVALTKNFFHGFILMLSYALGMGSLFLILGSFYGIINIKVKSGPWMGVIKKILGIAILGVAVFYSMSFFSSGDSLKEGLAKAQAEGKPVVIDFFAQSCVACVELDHNVWSKPEIQSELEANFVFVKIDCTTNTQECSDAVEKYQVIGWPTVIFLNAQQTEVESERIVGQAISMEEMLKKLKRIK